jgi:hypothetical protein
MMKSLLGRSVSTLEWQPYVVPGPLTRVVREDNAAGQPTRAQGCIHMLSGLRVIETSPELHEDGREYYHVSFSYPSRTPNYDDVDRVRKAFIGEDTEAVQIFPRKPFYINIHPYTLHLYACLTEELFGEAFFSDPVES